MPTQNPEQEMSSEEREYPRGMTEDGPRRLGPFRLAINVGAASLFISMMSIHLCSLLVIWLVRTLTDVEIDQHSVSANWVLPWGGLASVVIAVLTAVLSVMGRKNNDLELLANNDPELPVDLEAGRVVEEVYEFTEALRMQEQEHGLETVIKAFEKPRMPGRPATNLVHSLSPNAGWRTQLPYGVRAFTTVIALLRYLDRNTNGILR